MDGARQFPPLQMGAKAVPPGTPVLRAFVAEIFAGFMLLAVVFSLAVDPRGWGRLAPIGVSLTIGILLYCIGPVSSGALNPARALGPAVTLSNWSD